MYCTNCGREIPDESRFCKYCGTPVEPLPDQTPTEPQPPKKKKKWPWVLLICLVCAAAAGAGLWYAGPRLEAGPSGGFTASYAPFSQEDVVLDGEMPYVDSQLLLTAVPDAAYEDIEALVREYAGEIVGYISISNDYQIAFPEGNDYETLKAVADVLEEKELVDTATLNYVAEVSFDGVDYTGDPWNDTDDREDQSGSVWTEDVSGGSNWWAEAINMPQVWQSDTKFSEVKVGIIDSMFDAENKDLADRFVKQWNDPGDVAQMYAQDESDGYLSHGTHVAGIIAAAADNGHGIAGVSQNAQLYGYAMPRGTKTWEDVFQYKYAIALMLNEGVRVINISNGFSSMLVGANNGDESSLKQSEIYNGAMEKYLRACLDAGYDFLIVKAAGNNSEKDAKCDAKFDLFAGIEDAEVKNHILVVGAADNQRYFYNIAELSNIGDRVDIYAPGIDVLSVMPGDGTKKISGTSMAAPIVTGTAALVWGANPDLSADQVSYILKLSHTPALSAGDIVKLYQAFDLNFADPRTYTYSPVPVIDAAAAVRLALSRTGTGKGEAEQDSAMLMGVVLCDGVPEGMQTLEAEVSVYDGQGESVDSEKITVLEDEMFVMPTYSFLLPEGEYELEVAAEGFETETRDITVKARETVQSDVWLHLEGAAASVDVQDAYSYEGTATIEGEEMKVEYRFPKVTIEGVSTDALNAKLWSGDESQLMWVTDEAGRRFVSLYDLMTYDWNVTGDTLSILSVYRYSWGSMQYGVTNISVTTGQAMTDDEVLAQAGVSRETFCSLTEEALHKNFSKYLAQYWGRMSEEYALDSVEPVETSAVPFFNAQGHLSAIAQGAPAGDGPYLFLFDLETLELFEIPGYEMATRGEEQSGTEADASDVSIAVQDAYTYIEDYIDQYGDEESVEYHVPKVLRDGVPLDAVNDQIWDDLYVNDLEQYGYKEGGEPFYGGTLFMDYKWYVSGDILSIVVTDLWGPETQSYGYKAYNISLSSGEFLTRDEFLKEADLAQDGFISSVQGVLRGCINAKLDYDEQARQYGLDNTLGDDNTARFEPFFDQDGQLCAVAAIYGLPGPEAAEFLVNLETRKLYGEQAKMYGVADQVYDGGGQVLAAPPEVEEPDDGTWEIYTCYNENWYNQILLDPSAHKYIATINLLEAFGTVVGHYTEDETGAICCKVEEKDFWGYGSDGETEFWLQRQGNVLIPTQNIWNLMIEYNLTFEYARSFTVVPDSGTGVVTGDSVRFRDGPGTDYMIMFELNSGDTVAILGTVDDWYMVKYTNEELVATGFMSSDYIEKT